MMTAHFADLDSAGQGAATIAWARRSMPLMDAVEARLVNSGVLKGLRVGISLVLEPKTANLALALQNAGATVTVTANAGSIADASVIPALVARGIAVFATPDASPDEDLRQTRAFLATAPQILIDDGAQVTRLAHKEFPDLVAQMSGATEETTSGVRPLMAMHADGQLRLPVVSVNGSRLKYLFDNVYGTGQSCVMALLDVTNLQLAGRKVLVVGYGFVGNGVARHARALGAQVVVAELDPIKALQALHDGHTVCSVAEAAPTAEVVFASTGIEGVLTAAHVEALPDGAILCTAGGGEYELPMDYLASLPPPATVRQHVEEYRTAQGRRIRLVAKGACVNCLAGEGNPIEVMDLSLSLQACAVELLAAQAGQMAPGIHPIPESVEQSLALERLRLAGASVEPLTEALAVALRKW
jgi:adenosylhomocysteinase